jgi:hydroxymethylpyrimidine pyrophosphatase-like HAD family hydrolase
MIKHNIISFDFDGTLNNFFDGTENPHKLEVRDWVRRFKRRGYDVHIITRRFGPDNSVLGAMDEHIKVLEVAKELGISEEKIIFTNREWKHSFVKSIGACIHIDDEIDERIFMETYHPDAKVIWLGDDEWTDNLISEIEHHDGLKIWFSNEDNVIKAGLALIAILIYTLIS